MIARPSLAVLAAAIAIAGCGGGGDTASTRSGASPQGARQAQRQGRGRAEESGGGEKSIEEFGSEAKGPGRAAVLGAFRGYLGAIATEDDSTACSHLAATVRRSLQRLVAKRPEGGGCAAILPKLLSGSAAKVARRQAEGEIAKVRVEGHRGFVVFHAPGAKLYMLTMVREGGRWKAATVAASVLVPPAATLGL